MHQHVKRLVAHISREDKPKELISCHKSFLAWYIYMLLAVLVDSHLTSVHVGSCMPNLVNHQVLVNSMDSQRAHIGLYASRDIACGEELTYNYRYELLPGEGYPCHCGASKCRGRLY
ncbi:hypothetical protein OIU78_020469 [Salix suchowensis]|nr:hypothetical protein OIU78_020469 [Salix suchowensis]